VGVDQEKQKRSYPDPLISCVLSLNNSKFGDHVDRIYSTE
jgi:hypothetical protein